MTVTHTPCDGQDSGAGSEMCSHLMGCPRSYDFLRVRGDVSVPRDCRGLEQKDPVRPRPDSQPTLLTHTPGSPPYKVLPLLGRLMVRETLSR